MKHIILRSTTAINRLMLFIATLIISFYTFAQEGAGLDVDVTTETETTSFFTQPWVWVVGGAIFVLLLVALLRNNSRADK